MGRRAAGLKPLATPQRLSSHAPFFLPQRAVLAMIPPATPRNESARLEALRSLQILDTDAEDDYNRLVDFVARMCEVPICLVSLVDAERQWFKARHGLEVCQTGRDVSLCGHAILEDGILEIPDTHLDARCDGNPLVYGPPHIRFYAGAPIRDEHGLAVGTVCVIDQQPRTLARIFHRSP